jgi:hypothetical protein
MCPSTELPRKRNVVKRVHSAATPSLGAAEMNRDVRQAYEVLFQGLLACSGPSPALDCPCSLKGL